MLSLSILITLQQEAISAAGYTGKISIAMDTAASEFWNADMGKYDLDFKSPAGNPGDENRYVSLFLLLLW